MPIAKVRLPDGRIGRFEVPEGTTPEQVLEFATRQKITQPVMPDSQQQQTGVLTSPSMADVQPTQAGALTQPQIDTAQPTVGRGQLAPSPTADQPQPSLTGGEVARQAITNIPASAKRFGQDIISVITDPVNTAKGVASLGLGIAQKLIPGKQEKEVFADAFGDFVKERYGSIENLKKTIATDPVGAVADLSLFATGTGAALRGAALIPKAQKAGRVATALQKTGAAAQKVGAAIEPINIGIKGVVKPIAKATLPKGLPAKMLERSAKFSTTIPETDRARMIQTMLDNGIGLTKGGVDKSRKLIDGFNVKVTDLINKATREGKAIKVKALFTDLKKLRKEATLSDLPETELKKINKIAGELNRANQKLRKGTLTPKEAQKLKQNIYKRTYSLHGKQRANITRDTRKSIARRAKEEIEKLNPEIKLLNQKEGAMIKLSKELEKAVSRISNNNIFSLRNVITVGAGGAIGQAPGIAAALGISIASDPRVQSKIALAMSRARKVAAKTGRKVEAVSKKTTLAKQAAFQAGRNARLEKPKTISK
jgi:hypothetical protein